MIKGLPSHTVEYLWDRGGRSFQQGGYVNKRYNKFAKPSLTHTKADDSYACP